jgi:hypothetical protein
MKKHCLLAFLLGLVFVCSCRERDNMFDVGSDDFIPPPPIFWHDSLVTGLYGGVDSTLIGFRFHVKFADEFERTLIIHNELYYTDSLLFDQFDEVVGQGSIDYIHEVYGDIEEGPYYFRMFFGGLPIGYVAFLVQALDRTIQIIEMDP